MVLTGGDPRTATCGDVVVEGSEAVTMLEHDTIRAGNDLLTAARRAQAFVSAALTTASTWELGRGRGPVAHISVPTTQEN